MQDEEQNFPVMPNAIFGTVRRAYCGKSTSQFLRLTKQGIADRHREARLSIPPLVS